MPIYEYECPRCGRFDVLQKVSERRARALPRRATSPGARAAPPAPPPISRPP